MGNVGGFFFVLRAFNFVMNEITVLGALKSITAVAQAVLGKRPILVQMSSSTVLQA